MSHPPYLAAFQLDVRSYELDVYGHVNNAVYMNWLEHGRSRLLQDKGFTYTSITDAWGVRLVTVATHINFRAQLGIGDRVEVTTQVKRIGRSSVVFDQKIVRVGHEGDPAASRGKAPDRIVACDCETTICFTDPAMQGSVPVPQQFRDLYAGDLPA